MGFSTQEYWSELPYPSPGNLPEPGMESKSPALQANSLPSEPPQFSSVAQSCLTLCNPMDCNTPGFPVHLKLLEPTQTHVYHIGDAIQPSHPLLSLSPPAFNLSQHRGLFQWVFASGGQNIGTSASASVLPMNRTPWTVLKGKKIWHWKMSPLDR